MTHPLTDEFIRSKFNGTLFDQNELGFEEDEMRAAYDKGFDDAIECIREAGLAHYSALYEAQENFYNLSQQQEDN